MPFPTLERLQLADGEASLTWLGRFEKRVGRTQEAYFGLIRLGRIPLFLETVALEREQTGQREWVAFSINLLSPCCLSKLDGDWRAEGSHCTHSTPNRTTCGRLYPTLNGRTILSGDDDTERGLSLTADALSQWAEQFDYDPLSSVLLTSTVHNFNLRSLDEPDLEPMMQDEAIQKARLILRTES